MRVEVLVWIKDKIRGRYLGRHMDHLADSIAKLSQGRENWYIGREGIPVDDSVTRRTSGRTCFSEERHKIEKENCFYLSKWSCRIVFFN